jgi:hypothetical protein
MFCSIKLISAFRVSLLAAFYACFAVTANIWFYLGYNKLGSAFCPIFIMKNIFSLLPPLLALLLPTTFCCYFQ